MKLQITYNKIDEMSTTKQMGTSGYEVRFLQW